MLRPKKIEKKKSLGQHFLKSAHYLRAVADAAEITEGEVIVEVGPGEGTLTRELLSRGAQVIALEKDSRLIPMLGITFEKEIRSGTLEILEGDALEWETESRNYKVVGNIPYYITGALLRKFLSAPQQPSTIVFLMQKEVVERIARSKKESLLSLSIKAYGTAAYILSVPRGAFAPPPNVDSAILAIKDISRNNFSNAVDERMFFELLHAGFAQKRKLLRRNLEQLLGHDTEMLMQTGGIPRDARAEDVPLSAWLELAKIKDYRREIQ
jgi:16S rRNA (adenine1518-N6/adenine1519-N6)-dimethyltransferase